LYPHQLQKNNKKKTFTIKNTSPLQRQTGGVALLSPAVVMFIDYSYLQNVIASYITHLYRRRKKELNTEKNNRERIRTKE